MVIFIHALLDQGTSVSCWWGRPSGNPAGVQSASEMNRPVAEQRECWLHLEGMRRSSPAGGWTMRICDVNYCQLLI